LGIVIIIIIIITAWRSDLANAEWFTASGFHTRR
jgi:hypothetical protein